jgi:mRNA interferase RelE/StbE
MSYKISILRQAYKELIKLAEENYQEVTAAINNLAVNPRSSGCKKLRDRPAWRIYVGDYQIIYEISDQKLIILVVDFGHRRDIYR